MELLGLRLEALGLLGQRAGLLLRLGLELLGNPLGMTKQGCSLFVPGWPGGGFRLALHRDHPLILPEDRPERERKWLQRGDAGHWRRRRGTVLSPRRRSRRHLGSEVPARVGGTGTARGAGSHLRPCP